MSVETQDQVIVWTSALRGRLVDRVLALMGSEIVILGVGGPDAAERDRLGRELDCATGDDFRKLLIDHKPRYVFVADYEGLSESDFAAAVGQGATVLTVEPVGAALSDWASSRQKTRALVGATALADVAHRERQAVDIGRVIQVPAMVRSRGWLRAADPSDALGTLRLVTVSNFGGRGDWSLFGRLFDAWRVVLEWSNLPLTIDASLTGTADRIPENLRDVSGSLAAHARLPGGGAATVAVNDATGGHSRRLEVVGDGGRLTIQDHHYRLFDQTGHPLDESASGQDNGTGTDKKKLGGRRVKDSKAGKAGKAHKAEKSNSTTDTPIEDLIAEQWRSAMASQPAPSWQLRQVEDWEVTACCLASLLSARTSDPERPGRLLELHGFA